MCGIAAVFQHPKALSKVRTMLPMLRHRGDSHGFPESVAGGTSAMGAERLRIVDARAGHQPVASWDGNWMIVFNGEIYNHTALREEMEAKGIVFRTQCDTEVLANLIASDGPAALGRLDGMFAFVAIHRDGRSWTAGRDPLGIKPLYFVRENSSIYFASEILPLLEVSTEASVEIFPPGEWRTESASGRHWNAPVTPPFSALSMGENAIILRDLIESAVIKRIPPDLPCAMLFSGGIDSTLIFHIARKHNPEVRGFYVGNPNGKDYAWVKLYAMSCDATVQFVSYSEKEVFNLIPDVVRTLETFEPNQVRNGIFSWLVSHAAAASGFRVALCGEGADELFCGYPELCRIPAGLSRKEGHQMILRRRRQYMDDLHRTQLQRVDRCGMRHGLEVRVPFLDREILDFVYRLPVDQLVDLDKDDISANKCILRALYQLYPEIPPCFAKREKIVFVDGSGMGNNAPTGPLFEHGLQEAKMRGLEIPRKEVSLLKNLEEAFYLNLLELSHGSCDRMPFLEERPQVNCI